MQEIRQEINDLLIRTKALNSLLLVYTDLNKQTFFKKDTITVYCSTIANWQVLYYGIIIQGKQMQVWPYLFDCESNYKIYSDPPYFVVGNKDDAEFSDVPISGWKKQLIDANISKTVINKISKQFKKCKKIRQNAI